MNNLNITNVAQWDQNTIQFCLMCVDTVWKMSQATETRKGRTRESSLGNYSNSVCLQAFITEAITCRCCPDTLSHSYAYKDKEEKVGADRYFSCSSFPPLTIQCYSATSRCSSTHPTNGMIHLTLPHVFQCFHYIFFFSLDKSCSKSTTSCAMSQEVDKELSCKNTQL